MAKRKYTKRNTAYWQDLSKRRKYSVSYEGSALQEYHKKMREAKKYGGDYQAYVERFYQIQRNFRKKKIDLKKELKRDPQILTYQEFERKKAISKRKINPYETAVRQFGLVDSNTARALQEALAKGGFRINLQRAQARALSLEEWEYIDQYYHTLIHRGYKGKNAQFKVSQYFFGS